MKGWINAKLTPPPENQTVVLYGVQYSFDKDPRLILGSRKGNEYNSNHEGECYRIFYWAPIPIIPGKGKKNGISQ